MFRPQDIYTCDESGGHTVHIPGRIVSRWEQKQVGAITSREWEDLVTTVTLLTPLEMAYN